MQRPHHGLHFFFQRDDWSKYVPGEVAVFFCQLQNMIQMEESASFDFVMLGTPMPIL